MTRAEIIYQRRIAVLDYAVKVGDVAEACGFLGISRNRYTSGRRGRALRARGADAQGSSGAPDARGHPHPRNRSVLDPGGTVPTIGCRQFAVGSGPGLLHRQVDVQKHLVAHGFGKRSQRLARAAVIAAATTG